MTDTSIYLIRVVILQCLCISNHHAAHFKYIHFCSLYLNKTGGGKLSFIKNKQIKYVKQNSLFLKDRVDNFTTIHTWPSMARIYHMPEAPRLNMAENYTLKSSVRQSAPSPPHKCHFESSHLGPQLIWNQCSLNV